VQARPEVRLPYSSVQQLSKSGLRRIFMDFMHQIVPEEEVYQMAMLFALGVVVGAIAGVLRYFKAEGRKA
jgi:hypothetical protein